MSLWQAVLGSMCGIIGGIVIGCSYYYVRVRYVENRPSSMRAILSVFFAVGPKVVPSSGLDPSHHAKQQEIPTEGETCFPLELTANLTASSFQVQEDGKRTILGILSEFASNIKLARGSSSDVVVESGNTAAEESESVCRGVSYSLRNDIEIGNEIDSNTESEKRDERYPMYYTHSPCPACTSTPPEKSIQCQNQNMDIGLPLLRELDQNRKAIAEFSGEDLVP